MEHWADRLSGMLCAKGNAVCVGLDPRWERLPGEFRKRQGRANLETVAEGYESFCLRILELIGPLVPVVKVQSAFFELCGPPGLKALQTIVRRAKEMGLFVILDGKRNDVSSTAQAYAEAAFAGISIDGQVLPVWDVDAITVNAYLGRDSVEPFLKAARAAGRGIFVLVRTSNPGAGTFQDLECNGVPLYMHVAHTVLDWTREHLGKCGFGDVGAVVGATHSHELAVLRSAMPNVHFLVPGYGAQGARAEDTAPAFRADGLGAIINSSRDIIFPCPPADAEWEGRVIAATNKMVAALTAHTSMQHLAKSAVKEDPN